MKAAIILLLGFCVSTALAAAPRGSVCVAPVAAGPETTSAPGLLCRSGDLSFRIDSQAVIAFSHKESLRIDDLDAAVHHRVTILCDGKPQQSFSFRFAQFESSDLCLFVNDLHQTAQLWEKRSAPWCRCR